jgi:hypothetical protein
MGCASFWQVGDSAIYAGTDVRQLQQGKNPAFRAAVPSRPRRSRRGAGNRYLRRVFLPAGGARGGA